MVKARMSWCGICAGGAREGVDGVCVGLWTVLVARVWRTGVVFCVAARVLMI
jgi:hypothetical protein